MPVFQLSERLAFPPARLARADGLLAVGGDLSPQRLLLAYRMGIFPWFLQDEPILWWSPDPRLVLFPDELHVSRRLRRLIRQAKFRITADRAFEAVIRACAETRLADGQGTWIDTRMIDAYCRLAQMGYAHSVEAWLDGGLAGGLYGVQLGGCFFGESMFTRVSNASKVAFVSLVGLLVKHRVTLIDCQVTTQHMLGLGAREIPRDRFLELLAHAAQQPPEKVGWYLPDKVVGRK